MSTDKDDKSTTLAPDEAFSVLGNKTRMEILQTLGEADEPLSFSELHDRVEVRDSGQFNYHLDQVIGHFVEKTDDGYEFRRAGARVIEAVLSGAVTEDPVIERTEIDHTCHYCGAPLVMSYQQESTATFCTECEGTFDQSIVPDDPAGPPAEQGFIGYLHLPPAGLTDRTPTEIHSVAFDWQMSEVLPTANGTCPRCSAPIEPSAEVCGDHTPSGGICEMCGDRHAVQFGAECTNCLYEQHGPFVLKLLGSTELLSFLAAHDINPASPSPECFGTVILNYEETILETDPLEARFAFEVGEDQITLTVDDSLAVTDVMTTD